MTSIVFRYLLFSATACFLFASPSRAGVVFERSGERPGQPLQVAVADLQPASEIADKINQPPATLAVTWRIQSSEQLAEVFRRWAKLADWQLVWEAPDLVAQTSVELTGDFEEVVGKTIDALNRSGNGLQARFYVANRVLRIIERK